MDLEIVVVDEAGDPVPTAAVRFPVESERPRRGPRIRPTSRPAPS